MIRRGELLRHVFFPLWEEGIRGRSTLKHLAFLEETQWWSEDALAALQAEKLRRLVAHAFTHVPYYREQMRAIGLVPSDIKRLDDVRLLPILTREGAAAAGSRRESTFTPFPVVRKMTGGTTGQPLLFGYDRGSEDFRQAVKLRGWGWAGYFVGSPTFFYWGLSTSTPPPLGRRLKIATDRRLKHETYMDCTERNDARLAEVFRAIERGRPEQIVCFTQAGADLARFVLKRGLRLWKKPLPVLCCAERLSPTDRDVIEQAFGPAVFETYGCREVMLIGSECEEHHGLHLSMENLLVEVIVREPDGRARPAEPGEMGEVVITDLNNYGMPFIRYANGDLATMRPPGRCACGRGLARLASVEGRVADALRDARGELVCGILISRIFTDNAALAGSVHHWQAVQQADGAITVKVVCRDGAFGERARADLQRNFDRYLRGVPLTIEQVSHIPAGANGKRRTVISEKPWQAPAGAAAAAERPLFTQRPPQREPLRA